MKKMMMILLTVMFILTVALADGVIPTKAVTIAFDANATTGYTWNGFVLGGDAVVLDSTEGTYLTEQTDTELVGVGGQTYFTLIPVKTGSSILTFTYSRSWEGEAVARYVVLAVVDEEMNLYVSDVTESGVIEGTVISVDTENHSVLLSTESHGDVQANFAADMALPVIGEQIEIYTDGTMTMSLPAIMNVIAWNTVPSELARQ